MHRTRARILPRLLVALAALAAGVAGPPVHAQEAPTSPARYLPPPGYRTKEFTLVRDGGLFHLFYLRENLLPGVPTQLSFGHAVSPDLYAWTERDTILPVVPGTFEGTQVWAPSLHRIGGLWYLFYPGMRHEPPAYQIAQEITYATSPDLETWTRRDSSLFGNTLFPWAYVDSSSGIGRDCRDPFLWWDAARGEWLLYVAVRPASQPTSMTIGIAGSTDLEHWEDRGMMPLALPSVAFSDVAESPHVFTRDGSLLLILWTTDAGQSLTFGRSTDAVTGWNTSRRLRSMLGYSTSGWWGSEFVADGNRRYFGVVHNEWIDLWDATWTAADTFRVTPPDPLQVLALAYGTERGAPGDTVTLAIAAVNAAGRKVALRFARRESGEVTPLAPAALALPDSIELVGDTTTVTAVLPPSADGRAYWLDAEIAWGAPVRDTLAYAPPLAPPSNEPPLPQDDLPIVRVVLPRRDVIRFVTDPGARVGALRLEVLDVRGRRVWRGELAGAGRSVDWNADGGEGRRVPAGVYFARARGVGLPAGGVTRKFVILP